MPGVDRPDLPEWMTWEELEALPEEVAAQIELSTWRRTSFSATPGSLTSSPRTSSCTAVWSQAPTCARLTRYWSARCCHPRTPTEIEAKKARYAGAGIPSYWEVELRKDLTGIAALRVYILETGHAELPPGVRPLRNANYLLAGEWTPDSAAGISFPYPFSLEIPWSELAF